MAIDQTPLEAKTEEVATRRERRRSLRRPRIWGKKNWNAHQKSTAGHDFQMEEVFKRQDRKFLRQLIIEEVSEHEAEVKDGSWCTEPQAHNHPVTRTMPMSAALYRRGTIYVAIPGRRWKERIAC